MTTSLASWLLHLPVKVLRRIRLFVRRWVSRRTVVHALWNTQAAVVRVAAMCRGGSWRIDREFARRGVRHGVLPAADVNAFIESLAGAVPTPIREEDIAPGYEGTFNLRRYHEAILNASHRYLALGPAQEEHLAPLLRHLAEPVAACVGSPWRVVNVRCWATRPNASETGPNQWHADGFPRRVLKMMLYFSETGPEQGTTAIKLRDGSTFEMSGPPGSWLLFKNSELKHRGVAPKRGERIILEVTLVPSLVHDQRPLCAGLNAMYPTLPWRGRANRADGTGAGAPVLPSRTGG